MQSSPQENFSEAHDLALRCLHSLDQRYTPNRHRIVESLARADAPLTIDGVRSGTDKGTGIALPLSSTYRNLAVLEQAGIVHRIVTSDNQARFELTEAVTGKHHHHLVCTDCGLVLDVTLPDELEATLQAALKHAAANNNFAGAHHRIDLVGLCETCQTESG